MKSKTGYILLGMFIFSLFFITNKAEAQTQKYGEYVYIEVHHKFLSKKLKVFMDFGDSPEQIKKGDEYSNKLTGKKSYIAILNYMFEEGYELHYSWITKHLSEGLKKEECTFVLDVLDMYGSFNLFFNELKKPERLTSELVKFPGFDRNNEIVYLAYTNYCIEDLDRFN